MMPPLYLQTVEFLEHPRRRNGDIVKASLTVHRDEVGQELPGILC